MAVARRRHGPEAPRQLERNQFEHARVNGQAVQLNRLGFRLLGQELGEQFRGDQAKLDQDRPQQAALALLLAQGQVQLGLRERASGHQPPGKTGSGYGWSHVNWRTRPASTPSSRSSPPGLAGQESGWPCAIRFPKFEVSGVLLAG